MVFSGADLSAIFAASRRWGSHTSHAPALRVRRAATPWTQRSRLLSHGSQTRASLPVSRRLLHRETAATLQRAIQAARRRREGELRKRGVPLLLGRGKWRIGGERCRAAKAAKAAMNLRTARTERGASPSQSSLLTVPVHVQLTCNEGPERHGLPNRERDRPCVWLPTAAANDTWCQSAENSECETQRK